MKLKDAYERWGQQHGYHALYVKTHSVFMQAWSKLNWDSPCKELTLPVLTQALANKKIVVAEIKIRAASVMVHVLKWAHEQEPNETPKPLFEYCDLLNATKQKEDNIAIKELKQKKNSMEQKEPNMEQEKDRLGRSRNRAPRAVVQIDPKTLQVIKIWPKMTAAEKILGIFAIERAIKKCRPAGGFYWCNEQDVTTFQPAEDRRGRTVKKATIKQKKTQWHKATEVLPMEGERVVLYYTGQPLHLDVWFPAIFHANDENFGCHFWTYLDPETKPDGKGGWCAYDKNTFDKLWWRTIELPKKIK